jgi:hypothetical protein
MNCPKCHSEIDNSHINIQTDVAQCINCNHIFRISKSITPNLEDAQDNLFDINTPPKGAWVKKEMDKIIIGATTRSPIAFFLVPFMIVWSGGSIGGIYGTQIAQGEFNLVMSLFGIPFLLGSILFWSIALLAIWGKVELTLDRTGGTIFTGIGNLGLRNKFKWDEISGIQEGKSNTKYPGSNGSNITLEGRNRISFGAGINDSRQYYIYKALKSIANKVKNKKQF